MTKRTDKEIGTVIDVPDGATVVRPDGTAITVTGGAYALDTPGVHIIDGREQGVTEADGGTVSAEQPSA